VDPLAAIRDTFFQECEEQLAELESGLLAIEEGDRDPERINAVFRAVHSIKGGAGAFGLDALVRFSHVFETALDEMRSGGLAPEDFVLKEMLRAADLLADHVAAARGGPPVDEARSALLAEELAALTGAEVPGDGEDGADFDIPFEVVGFDGPGLLDLTDFGGGGLTDLPDLGGEPVDINALLQPADPMDAGGPGVFAIRFKPTRALYSHGNETALLLRELRRLGETRVSMDAAALPLIDALDPSQGYAVWAVELTTSEDIDTVREVFEFVDGHCELDIRPAGDAPSAAMIEAPPVQAPLVQAPLADLPAFFEPARAQPASSAQAASEPEAEIDVAALIRQAQAAVKDLLGEPEAQAAAPAAEPIAAAPIVAVNAAPAAPQAQAAPATVTAAPAATIRVDLERVDRLIDLVGELVINQAVLAQRAAESGLARHNDVAMGLDDLEQLTREIQDSVMAIRAQPVKSVFQRMPRLVREVAAAVGKEVRLVTEGENTEVDKTVIERLSDPITHMIRNAIDHGLESPDKRTAAGKPAEGQVKLAAFHRSGRIVIEVSDDGAGINRPRVRDIAAAKGLIDPNAPLTDEEIDNLIFLPGFSTASTVSDISGRGVGMDVVKRSIAALGGRISINSTPGKGSVFTMSLPLTLAVLDGMVVSAAGQTLIAPLSTIIETLQPKTSEVKPIGPNAWVMSIRDSFVPLIDVGMALGYRTEPVDPATCVALLVEEGANRAALLVDTIQGQRQVVIKSLEANYRHVPGIAAATILGDGRVALILDVDAVVSRRAADHVPAHIAA
jgi:two-component system chemotaxis sensor kinase CheA